MSDHTPAGDPEPLSVQRRVDDLCRRFEAAWQAGGRPRLEDYLAEAADAERASLVRELVRLDVYYRTRAGECPRAGDYERRFPGEEPLVRDVLAVEATQTLSTLAGDLTPAPAAFPSPLPVIAGYEILGETGRGGMGTVYRAHDLRANRLVALKVIRADKLEALDPAGRLAWLDRFRAEIEAAAHLEHPHIVAVYEVGDDAGRPYFTMRLVEGDSLARRLADGTAAAADPRWVARLLAVVARAVHYAHQHGILHRDLKPANVLIDAEDRPHLTDFGLAKRLGVEQAAPPEVPAADEGAPASGVAGTVGYMAPEQAAGRKGLTTAVDVYALGAILYDMLTGRPPFPTDPPRDVFETLRQVAAAEPVPPRRLRPAIPRDLEAICLKCLHKDPRRRYGSAEAVAQDLERFLEGRPTQARRGPVWERAWKWARRQPALAALVLVTALALLGLAGGGVWYNAQVAAALGETRRNHYAADMNLALQDWGEGHDELARARLLRHRPPPGEEDLRGFEWYYLWRLCHHGRTLRGHAGPVFAVALSPDGKTVATASGDRTVRLWDVDGGQGAGVLEGHEGMVVAVAFAPDGEALVTAGEDKTIRLWKRDGPTFRAVATRRVDLPLTCVAFAPDGATVAAGDFDGTLRVWAVGDGWLGERPRHEVPAHGKAIRCVAFSPDGGMLVSGSLDTTLRLWAVERDGISFLRALEGHTDELWSVAFSPDGKTLASASAGDAVRLWDLPRGEWRASLKGEENNREFLSVAFAPDGKTLATGGRNGVVTLWDVATQKALGRLEGHTGPVYAVAFGRDGSTLASGAVDRTVRLWDLRKEGRSLEPREGFRRHPLGKGARVSAAVFSPDGRLAATAGADGVQLWDTAAGREVAHSPEPHGPVSALAFSADGNTLVLGGEDGVVRAWRVIEADGTWQLRPDWFTDRGKAVLAVAVAPDGKTVASGGLDETVKLWYAAPRRLSATLKDQLKGHTGAVAAVAFAPDSQVLASGGYDQEVKLWRVSDGAALPALKGPRHLDWVTGLAFAPDGQVLASACDDCTIKLWDLNKGRAVATLEGHTGWMGCLAFSPDGKTLVTGGDDLTVKLWDRTSGLVRASLKGHTGMVRAAAFDPGGKTLLTVGEDRSLLRWQAATEDEVRADGGSR